MTINGVQMKTKYVFTHFGYGTGPFVRTLDMALTLRKKLKPLNIDLRVLMPLAYGDKQKRIITEDYGNFMKANPEVVLLDEKLGNEMKKVLYDGEDFNDNLKKIIENTDQIEHAFKQRLSSTFTAENAFGQEYEVNGEDVILEVSRNPVVVTNIPFSYFSSVYSFEHMIRESKKYPELEIDPELIDKALPFVQRFEGYQRMHFRPDPWCFSYDEKIQIPNEHITPPLVPPIPDDTQDIPESMYVGVTGTDLKGTASLENLYKKANKLGLKIFTNTPMPQLKNSEKASPTIVTNPNIKCVYTRPGWNSIFYATLAGKPLIIPEHIEGDFPEMFFNHLTIEKLKLGIVWKEGISVDEVLSLAQERSQNVKAFYDQIRTKFGTLDGISYVIEKITEDFTANYKH